MPIYTNNPAQIPYPDLPYDKVAINLAISSRFDDPNVTATASLSLVPYRILPNGTIESLPNNTRGWNSSDVYRDALSDPTLLMAISGIYQSLQFFISGKNL